MNFYNVLSKLIWNKITSRKTHPSTAIGQKMELFQNCWCFFSHFFREIINFDEKLKLSRFWRKWLLKYFWDFYGKIEQLAFFRIWKFSHTSNFYCIHWWKSQTSTFLKILWRLRIWKFSQTSKFSSSSKVMKKWNC